MRAACPPNLIFFDLIIIIIIFGEEYHADGSARAV
jgi:hypothetical protein